MSQFYNLTDEYASIWNKYRPAILRCMVDCDTGPQQYQFYQHEFKALNPKEKGSYAFTLLIAAARPQKLAKESRLAHQLFSMISQSKRGSELLAAADYNFELSKNLLLTVSKAPN
ncbi:MAG: hypothetical protein KF763_14520 [Cyclobacteriaceae bacterium]|nr:hypothetical protein [Cyclobacteriaceae bacterium]